MELIFSDLLQGPVTDLRENGNEHIDLICRDVFLEKMDY